MKNFKTFFINNKKKLAALLILIAGSAYFFLSGSSSDKGPVYEITKVKRGDIVGTITATGQVVTDNQVDIKSVVSGPVTRIDVKQGQKVKKGQTIAVIDQKNALIQLQQAQNSYKIAEANYKKFLNGISLQDKALAEKNLASSELAVKTAKDNLLEKLNSVYNQTLEMVNDTNNIFNRNYVNNPVFTGDGILTNNAVMESKVAEQRRSLDAGLVEWKNRLSKINSESAETESVKSINELGKVAEYFDNLYLLFIPVSAQSTSGSGSTAQSYTSKFASNRNTVRSNISTISSAVSSITTSKNSYEQAKITFDQKLAPAGPEEKTIQEANFSSAKIALQSAYNSYENTMVKSPIDGIVASVNAKIGEQASNIATLITDKKIAQIAVSENDIASLQVGQTATITLSSIPDKVFTGKVSSFDVIGTSNQGVVVYNAKVTFDTSDDVIKPNMSVTAKILTSIAKDVLKVDYMAVKFKNKETYVLKVKKDELKTEDLSQVSLLDDPEKVSVKIGVSDEGSTEIKSGLSEGDAVVLKQIDQEPQKVEGGLFGI